MVDANSENDHAPSGNHRAVFLEVPPGTRGMAFGRRIIERIRPLGLRCRVGIADDKFTAEVAASTAPVHASLGTCTSVPRGSSAVFLASLPIHLLPIPADLLPQLQGQGINTLGDAARTPLFSFDANGIDFQRLAGGEDPSGLRQWIPQAPIVETVEMNPPSPSVEPLIFQIRPLVHRIAFRLRGRQTAASRFRLKITGRKTVECVIPIPDATLLPAVLAPTIIRATQELASNIESAAADNGPIRSVSLWVIEEKGATLEQIQSFDALSFEAMGQSVGVNLGSPLRTKGATLVPVANSKVKQIRPRQK